MGKMIDITGNRFGKLIVIKRIGSDNRGESTWLCKCDCGGDKTSTSSYLRNGKTNHCGCMTKINKSNAQLKGGVKVTGSRMYRMWSNMKTRCNNKNYEFYSSYGGKGITYCDEWEGFDGFSAWAIYNGYSDELTLDRIDNEKGYYPDNCRFATMMEQQNNRTNNHRICHNGELDTLANWSRRLGIKYSNLQYQISKGKTIEEIIK